MATTNDGLLEFLAEINPSLAAAWPTIGPAQRAYVVMGLARTGVDIVRKDGSVAALDESSITFALAQILGLSADDLHEAGELLRIRMESIESFVSASGGAEGGMNG